MIRGGGGRGGGGVTTIYEPYKALSGHNCAFSINFEKPLWKVDQNENAYISYQRGRSKTHQNEKAEKYPKISGERVCSIRIEFNLRHNMQFCRFENGLVYRALE